MSFYMTREEWEEADAERQADEARAEIRALHETAKKLANMLRGMSIEAVDMMDARASNGETHGPTHYEYLDTVAGLAADTTRREGQWPA